MGISAAELVFTAATPVLQLALLAGVGAALAYQGILNKDGCTVLARMCFYVFTPALSFSKLAQAVSLSAITHFWPLVANMTLSITVGLVVGWAVASLLRTPAQFKSHALAAIAFGNVGNLPLVFVGPLCSDKRAVFYRALGENCEHVSIAFIAFDIAVATIFQFSLAIPMMRPRRTEPSSPVLLGDESLLEASPRAALVAANNVPIAKYPTVSDLLGLGGQRAEQGLQPPQQGQPEEQSNDFAGTGVSGRAVAAEQASAAGAGLGVESGEERSGHKLDVPHAVVLEMQPKGMSPLVPDHPSAAGFHPLPHSSALERPASGQGASGSSAGPGWHPAQQPTQLWGAGEQQQQQALQPLVEEDAGVENGDVSDSAWLLGTNHEHQSGVRTSAEGTPGGGLKQAGILPLESSGKQQGQGRGQWRGLRAAGAAVRRGLRRVDWQEILPLPTQACIAGIVVGCIPPVKSLLYGPNPPLRLVSDVLNTLGNGLIPAAIPLLGASLYRGPGQSTIPWRVTLGVLLTRLVLQPVLLTGLVVLLLHLRIFAAGNNPVFLFTLLLSHVTPTAINMQTLTVLFHNYPEDMSTILFYQYLASLLTLPAFIFWFLHIISTFVPGA